MSKRFNPKTIILEVEEHVQKRMRKVSLNIVYTLRDNPPEGTPRDTGWAANNWTGSVGKPMNGQQRTDGGIAAIASYTFDKDNPKPIFIVNNVPYINRLNNGHSKQSPAGFVERAIQKAVNI